MLDDNSACVDASSLTFNQKLIPCACDTSQATLGATLDCNEPRGCESGVDYPRCIQRVEDSNWYHMTVSEFGCLGSTKCEVDDDCAVGEICGNLMYTCATGKLCVRALVRTETCPAP